MARNLVIYTVVHQPRRLKLPAQPIPKGASIEDIDNSMKLGCGYPMGPLTLLDFVGNDTTYYIANIMFDEFKEARFASPPLLKRMVLAGWNGRKAGRGFYDYKNPANPTPLQLT